MRTPEIASLLTETPLSRRKLLVTTLASGFALAVRPVSAATIATDAAGLVAGEVKIPTADVEIPAYRAMPDGGAKRQYPVVLVVQEIFGVHEHIRDVCRRFAKAGYFAIAPEMYARQGDVSKVSDIKDIMPIVQKVPDAQVMSDLDAALAYAEKTGHGDAKRAVVTGFCWGGRITWLYAAHNPRLKAGVAWYGRLVGQPTELQPKHAVDVAPTLKVPVLGLYGGQDQGIPQDTVEQMRAALATGTSKSEIRVYPDAPHGFNADYRPSYREADANDAWARALDWFASHGAAGAKADARKKAG
jgi:carboxymethylenebutenolidase